MNPIEGNIRATLLALADPAYARFQQKLMPTVPPELVLGVRMPDIRRYARKLRNTEEARVFLSGLPHLYYDENCLHGALIDLISDFDTALSEVERFLPHIDNWAVCDLFCPKVLYREPTRFWTSLVSWLESDSVYTVRYALVRLTARYLEDPLFTPEVLSLAAAVVNQDYYVRMAQAWLFSMALVKQYVHTLPYLHQNKLSPWVHNKAIQKAIESRQLDSDIKIYLKTLKRPTKGTHL